MGLVAEISTPLQWKALCAQGVTVDLQEPLYRDGVLSTDKGGVVSGPRFRLQGQTLHYTRKKGEAGEIHRIEAEGDLMLEYGSTVFVGDRVEYDFVTQEGTLWNGRTAKDPWFVGGDEIQLLSDRSFFVRCGFISTCENVESEWQVTATDVHIFPDRTLSAKHVQFRFIQLPVFWVPSVWTSLESLFDAPIKYRIAIGGSHKVRLTLRYRLFNWGEAWRTYLRLDYTARKGMGGGIETEYFSKNGETSFLTSNYIASDTSLFQPQQDLRYRIQGELHSRLQEGTLTMDLVYDKLSDEDLPTDYEDRDFNLRTTDRSEFIARKQSRNWITNLILRLRLNSFQTVKQEAPSLKFHLRPYHWGCTGLLFDTQVSGGYLDYRFANDVPLTQDYNSLRGEIRPRMYYPIHLGLLSLTPEAGFTAIHYSNSPGGGAEGILIGNYGLDINSSLQRIYGNQKSIFHPYTRLEHVSNPQASPANHYIFDIDDGWTGMTSARFGVRHLLLRKQGCAIRQIMSTDVWSQYFFNQHTMERSLPRFYLSHTWNLSPCTTLRFNTSWDLARQEIGHFNGRAEWTFNEDLALTTEFRHRNAHSWRKAHHKNFFLDLFRSEDSLLQSRLSDRRDTVLAHIFYRLNPTWAVELQARHGWNRSDEPSYQEFDFSVHTSLACAWRLRFSYQHREHDERVAAHISLRGERPTHPHCWIPTWSR